MIWNKLFSRRILRYVTITVVLGAIGSGLWEWLMKPALAGTSDFVLNIATLGIQSFKDSLYRDIALGLHEDASLRLFSLILGFLPGVLLGLFAGLVYGMMVIKAKLNSGATQTGIEKTVLVAIIAIVFATIFFFIQASQTAYINRAVTHFNQLFIIASPYLTEDQRLIKRSQFAQINSRDDYVKVISSLVDVCDEKKITTPKFEAW